MFDFEARHVIEALRSGIPSRAVGQYFSEARPGIMKEISGHLDETCETGKSKGMIIAGKYGEGKTHLLNTVFSMAHSNNMVVSYLSLSKETPFDKLYLVYQKLVNNTFLPKRVQPGFTQILEKMTPGSPAANELLLYAAKHLNTEDLDEKFMLQADLEGDFIANVLLKQIYRRIYNERVKYNINFSKTKHCRDYFSFLSRLFRLMGYNGWVILIDETELIGRLSKKARLNAYRNMAQFLLPDERLEGIYTLFALGASYTEDVIETKHDYENLEEIYPEQQEPVRTVLNLITRAQQLAPLTDSEIREVLKKIQVFHGRAYDWNPNISMGTILAATQSGGYLLRTKLRAAIELLDQLYQYGEAGNTRINELGQETFEEDVPSLEEFDSH